MVKLSWRYSFKCKMRLCTQNVHTALKSTEAMWASVGLHVFRAWRWVSQQLFTVLCDSLPPLLILLSLRDTHTYTEQMKRSVNPQRWGELLTPGRLNSWASCWEPGGVMVVRLPRGAGWGACLTTPWPYSVSPPAWCRLAPTWRAPGAPHLLPLHLFNCITGILHQSTTQQGKRREGKLKFTNCWEKEE